MTSALDSSTLQRLALIRALYLDAVDQSMQPEPVSALSVLGFHDAVELFCQLAAEHQDATGLPKRAQWEEYWQHVPNITQKESMASLNAGRVGLKHRGVLPSSLNVEAFRASTTGFFEESTRAVFGFEFDAIDMADLVAFPVAREHLREADEAARADDVGSALGELAVAFASARRESRERSGGPHFSGWASISAPTISSSAALADDVNDAFSELASEVQGEMERLEETVEVIALGIDLRRWQRFLLWTPWVTRNEDGTFRHGDAKKVERLRLDQEHIDFCRRFVIDSSLRLQGLPPG